MKNWLLKEVSVRPLDVIVGMIVADAIYDLIKYIF